MGKVGKQNRANKSPGCVLDHGPHQVSVTVIGGRAPRSTPPAHVLDHGLRNVPGGMAGEPEAVAEINILSVTKLVFVEPARFDHSSSAIERCGRAG